MAMESRSEINAKSNVNFSLFFAKAILQKLWLKGFISDDEKTKIEEKNKENIK